MNLNLDTTKAQEWMLEGPGQLGRTVTQLPGPAAGEILVATEVGAISPGSERTLMHGTSPFVEGGQYPYQPGYLNIVEILDAGDRTLVGERGVAILGHRDFALVPYNRFIRIPPDVSNEEALLGVLAADANHAIDVAAVDASEDCLVFGAGALGVLTAWELSTRNAGSTHLYEVDPQRLELARSIAFPSTVEFHSEPPKGPFHTSFDCANTASAFEVAQRVARRGGSIVLIADGSHEQYVLSADFFAKGLYLGKTDSHPDLRRFLGEWFARSEDRTSLVRAAFRHGVKFADFPQAYLEALLGPETALQGLLPRVLYR